MFLLLYILIQLISACPYYCDKCDETNQSCESCNSQRELILFESNISNQNICQCKDNYIDVGGNQCLQCANNCIKCQQNKPSYCLYCGDITKTHRVLDENNKCICENGYYEVWFTYNCQNQQYDNQILQFIYILQQKQYIERLQQRYNYTEQTIAGINYMINQGVVNDSVNTYQYLHTINQNEILNLDTPYPKGQYYAQQFNNLYTLGIKLNLNQGINWMANVVYYGNPQYFKSSRNLYEKWSIGIFQFQLTDYPNQIFLQIAISENKNIASQNRLLNSQDSGNMTLFYYLGYNVNRYLEKSELDLIVNDILFIMIEKQNYVNQYSFNGLKIVTESCIDNYQINNEDCICPIDQEFYVYETVCYQICPENCQTCTKEVCIIDDKTKLCRDGYYQSDKPEFECDKCKQECVTCLSQNQCIKCQTQHINIDGSCITCTEYSKTIQNCKLFDDNCQCIECLTGYQLNQDNICINCPLTCSTCQFQDQCIICIDGYYLNNQKCDKCQNNCLLCQEYNICKQAEYGYLIDNGIVKQCPNKCQNYKENCLCIDCPILFYLQESTELCQNCVAPCEKCLDVNTCINCISEEYYYDNGKCIKCQEPCLLCKSQNQCITCINDEYYFDDIKEYCFYCTNPCKTCIYQQKQQICKTCIYRHYIYLTQCLECPKYCQNECYFDELNNFVQCEGGCIEGYYQDQLNIPFQCIKCPENCLACQSQEICIDCIQGSILKDKQCYKCNQFYSEYCVECDQQSCIKCLNGYEIKDKICSQIKVIVVPSCDKNYQFYNDVTNICESCIQNCYQCQNYKFCSICIDEYFEDQGTCIKCLNPCKNCKSLKYCLTLTQQNYYINSQITDIQNINYEKCQSPCKTCISQIDCIECIDGYFIQNEKCVECDTNCKTCTKSSQQCISCPQGYKLNNSVCVQCLDEKCQDCLDQCIQCNHLQIKLYKCFACLPGYVLIENECIKCSDSCKTCQDTINKCSSCPLGFYLTQDMICEKCDDGCIDCQIQTKSCTTCQTGLQQVTKDKIYYYCIKCPLNCKECISETECKICDDTTFLNDKFLCEKCTTPCKSCINKDECINCIDIYYFNEQKCQKCTGVCLQCTSDNDCSQCPSNYYLKDNNCEQCPQGCSTCIDQNTCTKCDNGYYLDGICIQCTEHCLKCQKDKCEICENNYKLSSDNLLCQQQKCEIKNCQQCDNNQLKCLICNTNFILDENGLQCTTQLTQNEIPQDQINTSEGGGSSLIYIAAAAGGSILIIILLIYKFDIYRICKLRIRIRRFDKNDEKYPEFPDTISITSI